MAPNESQIIEQVKQGNTEAFRIIVDRYRDAVYGLTLSMVANREEAEELAQDAFFKIFKSIKGFRSESKFSTWLYRITYNTCISHLRKSKHKLVEVQEYHGVQDFNSGYNNLIIEDNNNTIKTILAKLKPDDRVIIQLFYLEENSIKEIAEITGFSNANVKVKLHRSKQKLKSMMKENGFNLEQVFV
ncbi:TPA: RNA polymerase sigma factor [Candidatus Peregrinibacteria bacterium]|nr:RNA polymerase sigma factor [Candidatus Peregrinibacteria bacterium]